MRLLRIATKGFRNLADGVVEPPVAGMVLLGPNGHGKTNLLEAIYYPALFRSVRDAADGELLRFGAPAFALDAELAVEHRRHRIRVTYAGETKAKRVEVDGAIPLRLADHVGDWLAVAFLPGDVQLASGSASERRRFLDRTLAMADPHYLDALTSYRRALAQRNVAMRQRRSDVARAFDGPLARSGAMLVRARVAWARDAALQFAAELAWLGESGQGRLSYRGRGELAEEAAWPAALAAARPADEARGLTTTGPHRDDLVLEVDGQAVRTYGSTGQQRSAAVALKLIEGETLARARGHVPAFLLDDVFAELDGERQARLARRLADGTRQVFLSAAREEDVPRELALPRWQVRDGRLAA